MHAWATSTSLVSLLFVGALLGGCGATMTPTERVARRELVRCSDGSPTNQGEFAAALEAARVVYVGESHDQEAHHLVEREVIATLLERDPSLAVGLEMVQRPYQAPLDAYVAGTIDEAAMLSGVEWAERWRLDFGLYRPIFELARAHHVPLVALNARRELTRAIARGGEASLDPSLRAELPADMVRDDTEHAAFVRSLFGEHHAEMDPAMLERMLLAQLVWDETMGLTVAETMQREGAPHRMVVLAGRAHVERGLGIPRRAERRGVGPHVIVLPVSAEERGELEGACDFAWIVD
ncbi:MAG: ChaN family lipoprotein [Sandaracinus sp.]